MTKRKGPASGDPRCVEGGRKGGLVNVAKGRDFKELGRLGGQATIRLHGAEHMHRIRPQRTRKESQGAPETQD